MNCCLISIDGWGLAPRDSPGNAVTKATTPVMDELCAGVVVPETNPNAGEGAEQADHAQLVAETKAAAAQFAAAAAPTAGGARPVCVAIDASGRAVGLPPKVMGNSEVGHLGMGAGQVNFQDLVRINDNLAAAQGQPSWRHSNAVLASVLAGAAPAAGGTGRLHILGLVSDGGVHSHINHLLALIDAGKEADEVAQTYVHFFADGRDTPPKSSPKYLRALRRHMAELGHGSLATVQGRYYAMDRDKRWERTKLAFEAIVAGVGQPVAELAAAAAPGDDQQDDPVLTAVAQRHAAGETDEFLRPIVVDAEGVVRPGDTVVFLDFRADRMRQLVQCFALPDAPLPFELDAPGAERPVGVRVACMTQYRSDFAHLPTLFPPQTMRNTLAEWLAVNGRRQLHVAETEKYAHVTFFFNGGVETKFDGETREMIPSPKVATYDLQPEMSVAAVADAVCAGVAARDSDGNAKYQFVMCNMAPPDMVGHTGQYEATVAACSATDAAVGRVREACRRAGFALVVTSDHGNCERMFDAQGKPYTAHTTNLVPLCIDNVPDAELAADVCAARRVASLGDVAPTILTIMGLPAPPEMTGRSVLRASRDDDTQKKKQKTDQGQ